MDAQGVAAGLAGLSHEQQLTIVLSVFGQRCQISQDPDTGIWLSIEKPTPAVQNVIIAKTVPELAAKMATDYGADGLAARLAGTVNGTPLPRRHPE